MKNILKNFKLWLIGLPVLIIIIFIIQNAGRVNVGLLFWYFETSKSILILLSILTGALIGSIGTLLIKAKLSKKDSKESVQEPETSDGPKDTGATE